jgi:hypothetical protein
MRLAQQASHDDGSEFVFDDIKVERTEDDDLDVSFKLECERGYLGYLTVDWHTFKSLCVRLLAYDEADVPAVPTLR